MSRLLVCLFLDGFVIDGLPLFADSNWTSHLSSLCFFVSVIAGIGIAMKPFWSEPFVLADY